MFLQILVRSIATPPIGATAPILFPPNAGSLKYTSSAVASIWAFNIAFIEAPEVLATLMMMFGAANRSSIIVGGTIIANVSASRV